MRYSARNQSKGDKQVTPIQVEKYYGTKYKFWKITGMSSSTLGNWLRWGYVPELAQYKLEKITNGTLKMECTKHD